MATGKAHAAASITLVPVVGIAAACLVPKLGTAALLLPAGCLSGLLLTPDLDQEGIGHVEWKLAKATLGLGWLWVMYWWPYAVVMKHRSTWSHLPIVSTLIRVGYLLLPPLVGLALLGKPMWDAVHIGALWWWFCGLVVSDTVHWVMDGFPVGKGFR
jgi:uncharacterized metal-binding protein